MNAFKAPYDRTNNRVYLSIPVAPTQTVHDQFNLNYDHGEDSDGEVGPFFEAVEVDDDNEW